MKKTLTLVLLIIAFGLQINAQGIIINEVSNGESGTREYVELLVVGSQSQSTGSVDLTNWIIDDNNGEFDALTGSGVASGHLKFPIDYRNVPIGSIIVIYNFNDKNPSIVAADDPYDSNNDGIYIIPHVKMMACSSLPSSTIGTQYSPCLYATFGSWTRVGLRNGGDAIQIRKPDFSFYHGFSYGDVTNNFPSFPAEFGAGLSFNVFPSSGSDKNFYLDCGDWTLASNYLDGSALLNPTNTETPAAANTANNAIMIGRIKDGTFDYSNLGNSANCQLILSTPLQLAVQSQELVVLTDIDYDHIRFEKSSDGIKFTPYENLHKPPMGYYRAIGYAENGQDTSNVVTIQKKPTFIQAPYPNPTDRYVTLPNESSWKLFSSEGRFIDSGTSKTLDLGGLPNGMYFLRLEFNNHIILKK